ncbi:MAG TPA: UDP-N-acetylmuramate dehydrogenase [Candidatus Tyrphobacter sp.]|nr:UDP-N-acetylmuramate dehydrogenase [Candidatus Tyrphobacter sp.]
MEVNPCRLELNPKMFDRNVSLKNLSSFKIGGEAEYFLAPRSLEEAAAGLEEWRRINPRGDNLFVLGGGTNILWSDYGYLGLIIHPLFENFEIDGSEIVAGAGLDVSQVLNRLAEANLAGLEWAGGLPGTLGGAVFGNAGAFGGEMKDFLTEITSLDLKTLKLVKRKTEDCRFDYRTSLFRERRGEEIIVECRLRLAPGEKEEILRGIEKRVSYRKEKHPMEHPNIGSIFKNVPAERIKPELVVEYNLRVKTDPFPVIPAARLIAEAGLAGVALGGAMISPKHPNFIVNTLEASSDDVCGLIFLVKDEIRSKFGLDLETEVHILA